MKYINMFMLKDFKNHLFLNIKLANLTWECHKKESFVPSMHYLSPVTPLTYINLPFP